jgi:hypothetical protein
MYKPITVPLDTVSLPPPWRAQTDDRGPCTPVLRNAKVSSPDVPPDGQLK